jgi:hypothetical protein
MTPTFPSHLHIQAEYPVIGVFFYQYPKEQESFTLDLKEKCYSCGKQGSVYTGSVDSTFYLALLCCAFKDPWTNKSLLGSFRS